MTVLITKCPVCGSNIRECAIDSINLQFLESCAKDGKLDAVVTFARIVWENVPELRLSADSRNIIEEVSAAMQQDLQKQMNNILKPVEMLTQNVAASFEKLPEEVKTDLQNEFKETKARLEDEFRLLRESIPTFNNVIDALKTVSEGVENITKKEIESFKKDLASRFRETLERMGFPEPEQMKLLAQLVPSVLPLLQELLRFQKVPKEKGDRKEREVLQELYDYFPEDDYRHLGASGDTDILASPKLNGTNLGWTVVIESKKNDSGWNRAFLQEVRKHMKMRGERLGILTVEVMPRGANGFMIEPCSEGVILVTSRDNFKVAYGALRAVLIALHPFNTKQVDIKKILADKKVEEAINEAFRYHEFLNNIRKGASRIINNAKDITQNTDDLDNCLKQCLSQVQQRINGAISEID